MTIPHEHRLSEHAISYSFPKTRNITCSPIMKRVRTLLVIPQLNEGSIDQIVNKFTCSAVKSYSNISCTAFKCKCQSAYGSAHPHTIIMDNGFINQSTHSLVGLLCLRSEFISSYLLSSLPLANNWRINSSTCKRRANILLIYGNCSKRRF